MGRRIARDAVATARRPPFPAIVRNIGPNGEDPAALAADTYWVEELYSSAVAGDMTDGAELAAKSKGRYVAAECISTDASPATDDEVVVFRIHDLQGRWRYFFELRGGIKRWAQLSAFDISNGTRPATCLGSVWLTHTNGAQDGEGRVYYPFSVDGSDNAVARTVSDRILLMIRDRFSIVNSAAAAADQYIVLHVDWIDAAWNTGTLAWGSQPSCSAFGAQILNTATLHAGGDEFHLFGNADSDYGWLGIAADGASGKYGIRLRINSFSNPVAAGTSYATLAYRHTTPPIYREPRVYWIDGILDP